MSGYINAPLIRLRTHLASLTACQELLGVSTPEAAEQRIYLREANDDGTHPMPRLIVGLLDGMSILIDPTPTISDRRMWITIESTTPAAHDHDIQAQGIWFASLVDALLVAMVEEFGKRDGLDIRVITIASDPIAARRELAPQQDDPQQREFWYCQLDVGGR